MEAEKKEEKIDLREGNISLLVQSYDYLFSDFDPRDYSQKILSEDFIEECKRAVREKEDKIELILLHPKNKRNTKDEAKIKKRLKEYFTYNFKKEEEKIKKIKKTGLFWFSMGALIMILATFLAGKTNFFLRLLEVMAIPASWFFFWEGLGKIIILSNEKMPNYEFYKKMSKANIIFADY